jgi:hypothetical protein
LFSDFRGLVLHFHGHFGGDQIGLNRHEFFAVDEARMAHGEHPKEDANQGEDEREHAQTVDAVKDGIEDESASSLAGQEIHGWDENDAEVHHTVPFCLNCWLKPIYGNMTYHRIYSMSTRKETCF